MIIYGKQLFLHMLNRHPHKLHEIYLAKECDKPLFRRICSLNLPIKRVDAQKAQAMAHGGNHQGFLALCDDLEFADINVIKKESFIAVLYGLSDVGNIGAIVRTAYALGCGGVVVVGNVNLQGVVRSSCGGAFELPIASVSDGLTLINELKQVGFKLYASAADGKSCKFGAKTALIMGSEGEGIPAKAIAKCDEIVGIKMKNSFDSLNVSAAFAIFCDRILNDRGN